MRAGGNYILQPFIYILKFRKGMIFMENNAEQKYFTYDGKPMVRRGDVIYYGDLKEKYVIIFTIVSKKPVGNTEIADLVTIELSTNNGNGKEKVLRKAKRNGLYEAFDVGEFWLRDTLENA